MKSTADLVKGYIVAALAAAAYGTNPVFAIPLYGEGMSPNSVLFFRYVLGLPVLLLLIMMRGQSLRIDRRTLGATFILGVLMAFSSLSLFDSYNYMNSGVASTLLFVYPVMVAMLMLLFGHEQFKVSTGLCLALMVAGLWILMGGGESGGDGSKSGDAGAGLSLFGVILVMISALTYALYIVFTNVSNYLKNVATSTLLFYVLAWGSMVYAVLIPAGNPLTLPREAGGWINLVALALIPTVISLSCTTRAIQLIGSTPTAILGGLEPVTAVVLSVAVLGQSLTQADIWGGCLIVASASIVVASSSIEKLLLRMKKLFPKHTK